MRKLAAVMLAWVLACPGLALAGQAPAKETGSMTSVRMSLEQRVGSEGYQRAGLNKLSPEEQWVLADWIREYTRDITAYVERQCQGSDGDKPKP